MKEKYNSLVSYFNSSRVWSFVWRAGAIGFVAALEWISSNLGVLELSPFVITVVGLALGEVTKALNNWIKNEQLPLKV